MLELGTHQAESVVGCMGTVPVSPFGELLKRHRSRLGMSQEVLAERSGMSASAVGALERGSRRAPYRDSVARLADALGLKGPERTEFEGSARRARDRRAAAEADIAVTHNVPTRLTSFIGREEDISQIEALLGRQRLVTLTGSGGVGKTRSATEVGLRLHRNGRQVFFVDLSPIDSGAFVTSAIASVLGVPQESSGASLTVFAATLRARNLVLILDNCEHVIDAAAGVVSAIVRTCPNITVLATSRERLAIDGEQLYRLPSLSMPASFQVMMDRAMAIDPNLTLDGAGHSAVAAICRRLEGIPLALEIAANRLPALGFAVLNDRLQEHFLAVSGPRDGPQRQRTMLATIAWSYDLLSDGERLLLQRLTIFRGGATLDAAEAVCADESVPLASIADALALLIDKSLLTATSNGERNRYVMLESVRAFASSKLREANQFERIARAHADWVATMADRADASFWKISDDIWLEEFRPEFDNVRAAVAWAIMSDRDDDAANAARIVGGLRGLWLREKSVSVFRDWAQHLVDRIDTGKNLAVSVRLMLALTQANRGREVFVMAERAIPLFEQGEEWVLLMSLYSIVAFRRSERGELAEAEATIARVLGLAAEHGLMQNPRYSDILTTRAVNHLRAGRFDDARRSLAEALRHSHFPDVLDIWHMHWRAWIAFGEGDVRESARLFEVCLQNERSDSVGVTQNAEYLATVRLVLNDIDGAETVGREALERSGYEIHLAWCSIWHWSAIVAYRGRSHVAARLSGFAQEARRRLELCEDHLEIVSYQMLMRSLRDHLAPETIELLQAEGARLDVVQAMDEALAVRFDPAG